MNGEGEPMEVAGEVEMDRLMTRRQWLTRQAILGGAAPLEAIEAVSSVALSHPDWDLDEEKTWAEWEAATL